MSDEIAFRHADPGEQPRRDFLFAATGAVGVGAAVWPLIDALNPSAEVLSLASIEVDLSGIEVGQRITVKSRGRPVFIWWRSPADIANARATPLDDLVDPVDRASENPDHVGGMPALDCNRSVDEAGEWLVTIGVCTHPGCVSLGQSGASVGDRGGWLPLPPVALRPLGPHPQRAGTAQPRHPAVHVRRRDAAAGRVTDITGTTSMPQDWRTAEPAPPRSHTLRTTNRQAPAPGGHASHHSCGTIAPCVPCPTGRSIRAGTTRRHSTPVIFSPRETQC